MRNQPSSFRVQKYLDGLRYPARKHDVLERARSRGADAQLLSVLQLLPERRYDSPIAVSCEVGRQAELAQRSGVNGHPRGASSPPGARGDAAQ